MRNFLTIGEEGVVGHIGKIHGTHARETLVEPRLERRLTAGNHLVPRLHIIFLKRVVVVVFFQVFEHARGGLVSPIRKQNDLFLQCDFVSAVRVVRRWLGQDYRAVNAPLYLHIGMRVIPKCTRLNYRKVIGKTLFRQNRGGIEVRHAILIPGQEKPVPVNRCRDF